MMPAERRRFWALVVITFGLAVLEVGSVVSILPFLQILANPDLIQTNNILAWLFEILGFETTRSFQIAIGVAVFLVTVLGLLMKIVTVWITTRFAMMRSYSISSALLSRYLHQPYEWFLTRHSSDLGTSTLSEVDLVVRESLLPAVRLIPEMFTVVLLVAALCLLEPWIALGGAAVLGTVYGGIFLSVQGALRRIGRTRMLANKARYHVVQEATGGVKELKIMGLEHGFVRRFRDAAYRRAKVQTQGMVISQLPRHALEAIAFGGMIFLVLILLVRGNGDVTSIVPTLGLIAAVGLRLIPAIQQLYMRGASLRQSEAALNNIHSDMSELSDWTSEAVSTRKNPRLSMGESLSLRDVGYRYPGVEGFALNELDVTFKANTTIGIVGGTGAGKTTLVDIMLGLLVPERGEIRVDGTILDKTNRSDWQRSLGYVPQTIFLSDGSVAENIAFGTPVGDIDMDAVERAARIAVLHDFVTGELPKGYQTKVGERGVRLSGGQRQRIGIARALYHDPSTLIFDEATSALDTLTEAAVMEAVHAIAGKKTIVMIAHRLSTVRDCDVVHLMRGGKVAVSGDFSTLVKEDDEFRRMAGDLAQTKSAKSSET